MNLTLYELSSQLAQTLDQVNEDGELPEGFENLRSLVEQKGAAVAAYIAQKEWEADALKQRVAEVKKRIDAQEKRCHWLRRYLLDNMKTAGITEIKSGDIMLTIKRYPDRDEAIEIFDEKQIPAAFMVQPEPPPAKPSKTAIKAAIKAGQDVPGAVLVKRDRLVIE